MDSATLSALADEIRAFIIESVTRTGGHLGAGLGVVELTLALFAEYDFDRYDKIVWDVGHQCYPHKILTGRAGKFASIRQWQGLSGFPDPKESPFDTVKTGHGGTSISTATGFALAWQARGDLRRKAIAVIGDGALQEGNAYEALNHAGSYQDLNLAVVLNDNGMSISPSVGALSECLSRHRSATPCGNPLPLREARRDDDAPPGILATLFGQLGFSYLGPIDGHDVEALRGALRSVRSARRPVLVHVVTKKGRGYRDDVPERTCYHASSPPSPESGGEAREYPDQGGATFTAAFARHAAVMAERDERVVVITAAMLEGNGLVEFQRRFPRRCLDVGMAEQHAVGLAAAMAIAGLRPICAIYSTFLQRAYDQLFQEVALQRARVVFCVDRAGLAGSDGATHNGVFDIAYLRCLPNFTLMAPRDTGELAQMMDLAMNCDGPVAIRYPRGAGCAEERQIPHADFAVGESETVADGADGCLLAYGPMVYVALEVRRRVFEQAGRLVAVINARFAKPLDRDGIESALNRYPVVFSLEDHAVAGGFGAAIAELEYAAVRPPIDARRLCLFGLPDRYVDHGGRAQQLADAEMDVASLTERVLRRLSVLHRRRLSIRPPSLGAVGAP